MDHEASGNFFLLWIYIQYFFMRIIYLDFSFMKFSSSLAVVYITFMAAQPEINILLFCFLFKYISTYQSLLSAF